MSMTRARAFIFLIFFPFMLAGCESLSVEKIDPLPPPQIAQDAVPSPVFLKKIAFSIPTGTPTIAEAPRGAFGLFLCRLPFGVYEAGISGRTFPSEQYQRVFRDTLEAIGYDVAGNPALLFDDEEDIDRAVYSIGARITEIRSNRCEEEGFWRLSRGVLGETGMTVEWSVYDSLHRKMVYKTRTKGYARLRHANREGGLLMLEQAFAVAAHNLGGDPQFSSLVFEGREPQDKPDPALEKPERIRTFDPQEAVKIEQKPLLISLAKGHLERLEKAAVLIRTAGGHGSGFFITRQGHIITNAHVVGAADLVRVETSGKEKAITAEVLRLDHKRDVALLKLVKMPKDLSITTLPVRVQVPAIGEDVYAIGAPRYVKLQDTVTKGIVSAHRIEKRERQPYIQADVDIYPGNSGGPLLDGNGNLVGICVKGYTIASTGDTLGGLNWFIPIGDALDKLNIGLEGNGPDEPLRLDGGVFSPHFEEEKAAKE